MTIEAVIFDFGGVFTTSPVANFADYERQHNLPEKFIGGVIKTNINDNAFARYERSEISLDEFDHLFAEETRAAGHEVTGKTLVSMLNVEFCPEMETALDHLIAAGYKTGCITNTMPEQETASIADKSGYRVKAQEIMAKFDHLISSSVVGIRKPEPCIYEMMCEALGKAPENCVFLDDLGVNLKPAMAMGMKTIKVPIGDVKPAIRELSELLGLPL